MKIVFETTQDIALSSLEQRSKTVRVGVGAFLGNNVHTVAYLSTKGVWGVFSLTDDSHRCQPGCGLKTELLGVARALGRTTERPEHLTIAVTVLKAGTFLDGIKSRGVIPQWDYSTVIPDYAEQLGRLSDLAWCIGSPTSPATEAREIARRVHSFVTSCSRGTPLPKVILSGCNKLAEQILGRA
ncbi:MAG TPA: hypothetical protein VM581_04545 [Magnetospirillaceae bacterium]|nr:hypothetical protein [Magnetospirillaceae bacterium]